MVNTEETRHVYKRTVEGESQDSLSLIAQLIQPGQSFLDLGVGAGGLGQYLSAQRSIEADGVTYNPDEAALAGRWYRRVWVADLNTAALADLLGEQRYDCIVCADVLEHLQAPQHLLAQCAALLKPGGRLLTSVPNAGYCGLLAELIEGDFRYRPEGLLDQTHLRFFTRRSLQRFFSENGWSTISQQTTQRSLLDSEFASHFDRLPPAVARHLLALPDAQTYQFISVLQPSAAAAQTNSRDEATCEAQHHELAHAQYSAQLFLGLNDHYDEQRKLSARGHIGEPQQSLVFNIPASAQPYTQLRLDPADRPGFFRLHHLRLRWPDGQLAWQWLAGQDPLATLAEAPQQHILFSPPWEMSSGALLLLHSDDPWLQLPLTAALLQRISQTGATLELCAGWPMSADYLQASNSINAVQNTHQHALEALQHTLQQELTQLHQQHQQLQSNQHTLQSQLASQSQVAQAAQSDKLHLMGELRATQNERNILLGQFNQIALHLQSIEQSSLFRVTRPVVGLKMQLDRLMGRAPKTSYRPQANPQTHPVPRPTHPVDIIVPVFRGLDDTRCCLESVLAASCQTAWRLIIINDCSPEPEVTDWLRSFATRDPRIELLENPENLGFVGTVNRGMALSADNDVLLLNSDAEVANDWLDRLQRAACSGPRVASVTPFSNNATICSYPRFCQANELPNGQDTASLDRLCAQHLDGQSVEVPTGVGFCMYIRRQCLQEVGLFDVANFGKGYGEENDFCVRAQQAGWVNLHALDTFVRHAGGISFGDSKSERELQAMETLRRLHPRYETDVHRFVQNDPARAARLTLDLARINTRGRPVILNVMHDREGGTLRHVQELAQHLAQQATFLRLSPAPGGVALRLEGVHEAFTLHFAWPQEQTPLLQVLRQLQVRHVHYHHLLGHAPGIADLAAQLGVGHDFTAHDYYSYCPQISLTDHRARYCGEQGLSQCQQCLQRHPAPAGESIESWRTRHARLLGQARYLIAPSADAAVRLQRFVPIANVQVVPHATLLPQITPVPQPAPHALAPTQALKIVVLGALSQIKGADVLEEVAILAARQNRPIEFHLLGYAYRNLRTQPKAHLTVHGSYEDKELPALLQWLQPDAIWFPAVWPETYSYTLSASLDSGLPIISTNLGAFAERLQRRDWTWLCDWRQTPAQWLAFFMQIREQHFVRGIGPGPLQATQPLWPTEASALTYAGTYLQALDAPEVLPTAQLLELQQQLTAHLQSSARPAIKSTTLQTLMRLRTSRALSPLARLVPMHLQRRVKSWLGS